MSRDLSTILKNLSKALNELSEVLKDNMYLEAIEKMKSEEITYQKNKRTLNKDKSYLELLEKESELRTREDFIKGLKISNHTLGKYIKEGIITPIKVGRRHLFTDNDYDYLENIRNAEKNILKKKKK